MFGLSEKVTTALFVVAAAVALALGVWAGVLHHQRDAARADLAVEQAAHKGTEANVRAGTAQAKADDLTRTRATEGKFAAVTQEQSDDLPRALAAGRADAARHAGGVRHGPAPAADPGGRDLAHLPAPAGRPSAAPGAGRPPELDDAEACAAAVVKAEAWQQFWSGVKAASDADQAATGRDLGQ